MIDFALSRMLGLYVVARLAQRYNIKVQLRHSWYGGVTALVLLPLGLTVQAPVPESLEAAQNGGHRPQLAPPARPNLDGAPVQVAPPVAAPPSHSQDTGDGQPGGNTPIFEAARSDWFEDEDVHRDHLPLRRHGAEQPHTVPEEAYWAVGAGPEPPPTSAADPPQQPPPTPPAPAPPTRSRHLRAEQPSTLASSPPPAPETPLTTAGLPRRVPRANLAPGMLTTQTEQEPAPSSLDPPIAPDIPTSARARSPEQVRSMLASYRSGVERGRTQAGPEPATEMPRRSSRSDDDPTQ
jgi:hypothetical protein